MIKSFEKAILLHTIDEAWKENLRELDELRHSVQNASYEQKDPLLIYKLESYNLFKTMVETMNRKSSSIFMRAQIPFSDPEQVKEAAPEKRQDYSKYRTEKEGPVNSGVPGRAMPPQQDKRNHEPIRVEHKVVRNDPCPCGSGKKFKQCHGKEA